MHVNAVSISASASVYLSASISASVAVFVTSFAHLDTLRFISSTKCAQFSNKKEKEEKEELLLCCKLIELSDLRINWHSNAKIDTNWGRACKCAKDSTEKVTWISKLYGQQLGNAFKSIDKMKCNPLVVAPHLSSIPPLVFLSATATAFMYLQTALSFV